MMHKGGLLQWGCLSSFALLSEIVACGGHGWLVCSTPFAVAKEKGQGPLTERGGAFAEKKQKKNHERPKILCLGTCVGIAQRGD
jgi:hypothetical protein